ncbi:protein phosphatase 1 regulatory subunit 32 isoform X2 [Bombina bombina]|uniref:protein phosphatase 1 regulatory subunit 32 isoform X2 n=1 Tax=Bombina bombina TaxID=8345 RepID=UPI00235A7BE9|nr:protein phosphatase 1 regulatory subunit 32 isoform X2 [Bombina bombina]
MGRLPTGVVSQQVRGSVGGSKNPLNFYCTSYNSSYGLHSFMPEPGNLSHRCTGYQSNLRKMVYYSPSLDRTDNPGMGLMCLNNYTSMTNRDFKPLQYLNGCEPIPPIHHPAQSGFTLSYEVNNPKSRAVKSVCFDTRGHGASSIPGIIPKHKPFLSMTSGKGSSESENFQHGPAFMSTEYRGRFTGHKQQQEGSFHCPSIGCTEKSAFTEESDLEPITYHPPSQYRVPRGAQRTTGLSITHTDFITLTTPKGNEPLPSLARNSEQDSGFTREKDVINTNTLFSNHGTDDRLRHKMDLLGHVSLGEKELSGFSHNNAPYVPPKKDPAQYYLTDNSIRFSDPLAHGKDREGWTRGGIQKQRYSGFVSNNRTLVGRI